MWGIFHILMSVPHNIAMGLNNVMYNRWDLETLGFRPIRPKNLPGHCREPTPLLNEVISLCTAMLVGLSTRYHGGHPSTWASTWHMGIKSKMGGSNVDARRIGPLGNPGIGKIVFEEYWNPTLNADISKLQFCTPKPGRRKKQRLRLGVYRCAYFHVHYSLHRLQSY